MAPRIEELRKKYAKTNDDPETEPTLAYLSLPKQQRASEEAGLSKLLKQSVYLPERVHLVCGEREAELVGGERVEAAELSVLCACKQCSKRAEALFSKRQVPKEQLARLMTLEAFYEHGMGETLDDNTPESVALELCMTYIYVRLPPSPGSRVQSPTARGTRVPLGNWVRSQIIKLGDSTVRNLINKSVHVYWYAQIGEQGKVGVWYPATVLSVNKASGLIKIAYHDADYMDENDEPVFKPRVVAIGLCFLHWGRKPPARPGEEWHPQCLPHPPPASAAARKVAASSRDTEDDSVEEVEVGRKAKRGREVRAGDESDQEEVGLRRKGAKGAKAARKAAAGKADVRMPAGVEQRQRSHQEAGPSRAAVRAPPADSMEEEDEEVAAENERRRHKRRMDTAQQEGDAVAALLTMAAKRTRTAPPPPRIVTSVVLSSDEEEAGASPARAPGEVSPSDSDLPFLARRRRSAVAAAQTQPAAKAKPAARRKPATVYTSSEDDLVLMKPVKVVEAKPGPSAPAPDAQPRPRAATRASPRRAQDAGAAPAQAPAPKEPEAGQGLAAATAPGKAPVKDTKVVKTEVQKASAAVAGPSNKAVEPAPGPQPDGRTLGTEQPSLAEPAKADAGGGEAGMAATGLGLGAAAGVDVVKIKEEPGVRTAAGAGVGKAGRAGPVSASGKVAKLLSGAMKLKKGAAKQPAAGPGVGSRIAASAAASVAPARTPASTADDSVVVVDRAAMKKGTRSLKLPPFQVVLKPGTKVEDLPLSMRRLASAGPLKSKPSYYARVKKEPVSSPVSGSEALDAAALDDAVRLATLSPPAPAPHSAAGVGRAQGTAAPGASADKAQDKQQPVRSAEGAGAGRTVNQGASEPQLAGSPAAAGAHDAGRPQQSAPAAVALPDPAAAAAAGVINQAAQGSPAQGEEQAAEDEESSESYGSAAEASSPMASSPMAHTPVGTEMPRAQDGQEQAAGQVAPVPPVPGSGVGADINALLLEHMARGLGKDELVEAARAVAKRMNIPFPESAAAPATTASQQPGGDGQSVGDPSSAGPSDVDNVFAADASEVAREAEMQVLIKALEGRLQPLQGPPPSTSSTQGCSWESLAQVVGLQGQAELPAPIPTLPDLQAMVAGAMAQLGAPNTCISAAVRQCRTSHTLGLIAFDMLQRAVRQHNVEWCARIMDELCGSSWSQAVNATAPST